MAIGEASVKSLTTTTTKTLVAIAIMVYDSSYTENVQWRGRREKKRKASVASDRQPLASDACDLRAKTATPASDASRSRRSVHSRGIKRQSDQAIVAHN